MMHELLRLQWGKEDLDSLDTPTSRCQSIESLNAEMQLLAG